MKVAVDHDDTVDHHRQADLFVVEGLVADMEDQVCLGLGDKPHGSVGGSDLRVRSGVHTLRGPAADESPQSEGEGEAHGHKYGT